MRTYTYGVSKDISNGIRNLLQSNYEVNPVIVHNTSELSYSNFDLRHGFILVEYRLDMECALQDISIVLLYR